MSITLKNKSDGSMGMVGIDGAGGSTGPIMTATAEWIATSVDKRFFVADRAMAVQAIRACVTVAGTDAGAVSAVIRKVPSGTAITAGTVLHSGSINLKGTADTNQAITLSTTENDLLIDAGDSLAVDFTGVLTLATGAVTVHLNPR